DSGLYAAGNVPDALDSLDDVGVAGAVLAHEEHAPVTRTPARSQRHPRSLGEHGVDRLQLVGGEVLDGPASPGAGSADAGHATSTSMSCPRQSKWATPLRRS